MKTINIDEVIGAEVTFSEKQTNHILLELLKFRKNKNISKNQLAAKAGVSHTTISRIENMEMIPSIKVVMDILDVYGFTLDIRPKNELDLDIYKRISKKELKCVQIMRNLSLKMDELEANQLDYGDYIKRIFSIYNDLLLKYSISEAIIDSVKRFGKYLSLVLYEYNKGQHNSAYNLFKEALMSCIDLDVFVKLFDKKKTLYRCRKKKNDVLYNKQNMFHIAYDKRYKVRTERYSYPGLPCLYLGETIDVCALELSCKKEELVKALVEFKNTKDFRIFDLTSLFDCLDSENSDIFLKNVIFVIMCSTKIQFNNELKNVGFREDYIFPQLLLEYIIQESILDDSLILGIKYFSVNFNFIECWANGDKKKLTMMTNYVFPAREQDRLSNFCPILKSCFEIKQINNE